MIKKTFLIAAVVVFGAVVAFLALRNTGAEASASSAVATSAEPVPGFGERDADAPSSRKGRLEEMKNTLALIAVAPKREPVEEKTGWESMPAELDALLAKEPIDPVVSARYAAAAEEFIERKKLEGTSVLGATCGISLCRIEFQHDNEKDFSEYQRYLVFSPWANASNYFSGTPAENGAVKSLIWAGRGGFALPLEDIRQRNASGEFAFSE